VISKTIYLGEASERGSSLASYGEALGGPWAPQDEGALKLGGKGVRVDMNRNLAPSRLMHRCKWRSSISSSRVRDA